MQMTGSNSISLLAWLRSPTLALLCVLFPALAVHGQDLAEEMSQRVESSLQEYRELEQGIAAEKGPLVSRLSELEKTNLSLRSELDSYRFLSDEVSAEIETLSESGKNLTSQLEYVRSAFDSFLSRFESRISNSETQQLLGPLTEIRARASAREDMEREFAAYADALNLSLDRIERNLGGERFQGKAIDAKGQIHDGKVLVFGPASYFAGEATDIAGMLGFFSDAIEPGITPLYGEHGQAIATFLKEGSGGLPLDATLGNALLLEGASGGLLTHLQRGGYVGYIIVALGLIALVISAVKLVDLAGFYKPLAKQVEEISHLAQTGKEDEAMTAAKDVKGIAGEVLVKGVENVRRSALLLEETMLSVILRAKPRMERYLPFLAITAAASPLLGLLGTVVGLIKTFALITLYGAGTPNALSSGISEALITTELGLIVAIPALVLHGLFARLVRSRVVALEQTAFEFVETAKLEAEGKEQSA